MGIYTYFRLGIYTYFFRKSIQNMYLCLVEKNEMSMIKVMIVDDLDFFRDSLQMTVDNPHSDIRVVGVAGSGVEFFELLKTVEVDVVMLDIMMPVMDGREVARRLRAERPDIKILAVSADNSIDVVKEMLDIGVEGYICKSTAEKADYFNAIHSIMQGVNYLGNDISYIIFNTYVSKKGTVEVTSEFTEQEKRIIELCRECLPGKLIADRLNISLKTVNNHKTNIFRKLGINSTAEMVRYAIKHGIIRAE